MIRAHLVDGVTVLVEVELDGSEGVIGFGLI